MTIEVPGKIYRPCSICADDNCLFYGSKDTHEICTDFKSKKNVNKHFGDGAKFKIIDKTTGEEPTVIVEDELAHQGGLDICDIEGFAVTEEGRIILCDECGRFMYCDSERFEVVMDD